MAASKKDFGTHRCRAEVGESQVRYVGIVDGVLTTMHIVSTDEWRKAGAPLAVDVAVTAVEE